MRNHISLVLAGVAALAVGCVYGPKQLEKGHLAYNHAVKSAADEELLLNIVRIRYLDTLDFVATSSISSSLSLGLTGGGRGGTDLETGTVGGLGYGEISYSTRPTFTFTPQRGSEFAEGLIKPVGLDIITYLVSSDWDVKMLLHLLVRRLNGLDNELGLPNPRFNELTDRLSALQASNQLFVGFVSESEAVSDPIEARNVSGTDLVEAAKAGFRFEAERSGGPLVLTALRSQPVLAIEQGAEDGDAVRSLLRLAPDRTFYDLDPGTRLGIPSPEQSAINVRTGSLLRAIIYLSQGIAVPEEHVEQGLTSREWPPGSPGRVIDDIFKTSVSKRRPNAQLSARHRGYWFYIPDDDLTSRFTFFHLAELFRLGLATGETQAAPVLTLPVGGP
jgi:hypothetical protein